MNKTLESLKAALRVISIIRAEFVPHDINKFEHSTFATQYGATSGNIPGIGELHLNYNKAQIEHFLNKTKRFSISANNKTQRELFDEVTSKLGIKVSDKKIKDTDKLKIDTKIAREHAHLQFKMHTALSLLKSRLSGYTTQVALWPHGFDVAFIWFKKGRNERKNPHMQFGFSPFGNYLFFYAWPVPEKVTKIKLQKGAKWNTDWPTTGASLPTKIFDTAPNTEISISNSLWEYQEKIAPLLE